MKSPKRHRYEVTGPGVEGVTYEDAGPALSRTITCASKAHGEATFYARDTIGDRIIGYSERDKLGHITTRRRA